MLWAAGPRFDDRRGGDVDLVGVKPHPKPPKDIGSDESLMPSLTFGRKPSGVLKLDVNSRAEFDKLADEYRRGTHDHRANLINFGPYDHSPRPRLSRPSWWPPRSSA